MTLKFCKHIICVDCHGLEYILIDYSFCYAPCLILFVKQNNVKYNKCKKWWDVWYKNKIILKKWFHPIVIHQSLCLSIVCSSFMLLWVNRIYAVQYVCNQLWKKKSLTNLFCQVFQNKYFFLSHNMKLSHRMIACWTPTVQNR
jgi:hypothetical protein